MFNRKRGDAVYALTDLVEIILHTTGDKPASNRNQSGYQQGWNRQNGMTYDIREKSKPSETLHGITVGNSGKARKYC